VGEEGRAGRAGWRKAVRWQVISTVRPDRHKEKRDSQDTDMLKNLSEGSARLRFVVGKRTFRFGMGKD